MGEGSGSGRGGRRVGGGDPASPVVIEDCLECRVTGAVTCYLAAAWVAFQRASVRQPATRRFMAGFSAAWFALGTARATC
jgi:hypothetical protein